MASWKLRLMLPMLLLLAVVARAQDVFNTGDSLQMNTHGDTFSSSCIQAQKPNIWKQLGVNPLTCHPQTMAQDSQGQCTLKGATLVSHQGTTCYYCEPQVPPGDIYISMDEVENASKQGYLCGESPVDPGCMSVCSRESPSTTTYVPPPPQTVPPPLQNGQATGDPCHPYYNLSTAAGQAAMQANAARDAAACNASRCEHNPQLTVCSTPGSKDVSRIPLTPPPPPPPPPPVNIAAIDLAMATCVNAKLSFKVPSAPQPAWRIKAIGMLPAQVRSTPFAQMSNAQQIFVETQAMALQAQAMHDQKYKGNEYPEVDAMDFMAGFLTNCIFKAGQQQGITESPFAQYDNLIGVPNSLSDQRAAAFNQGWFWSNLGMNPDAFDASSSAGK